MKKVYSPDSLRNNEKIALPAKEYSHDFFKHIYKGTIVDLGCGIGIDVNKMAQQFGQQVTVVGIDHDQEMIDVAQEKTMGSNTQFICSEANEIPFEDNSVDGLKIERVFQHLLNPLEVTQEIHRVLKRDGRLVITETDWTGITFYTKHIEMEQKIQHYLVHQKVNNGLASRNIPHYLSSQGFSDIELKVFPIVLYSLQAANEQVKIPEFLEEMTNKGLFSQQESLLFSKTVEELDRKNCFLCSLDLIVYSSKK